MRIDLNIHIDTTDRVVSLIDKIAGQLAALNCGGSSEPKDTTPTPVALPSLNPGSEGVPAQDAACLQATPAAPSTEEAPTPAQRAKAAIDATRARIEGADWLDNPSSEGYTKYHRKLTEAFRELLTKRGVQRIGQLTEEDAATFCQDCEALRVDSEGNIELPLPF